MKAQDDKELMEQLRRSHNGPSRNFEEVCRELGLEEDRGKHSKKIPSCKTSLKNHHNDLKNDPNRLSTKFIADVSMCKCRIVEDKKK
jgi:hypothetical protein